MTSGGVALVAEQRLLHVGHDVGRHRLRTEGRLLHCARLLVPLLAAAVLRQGQEVHWHGEHGACDGPGDVDDEVAEVAREERGPERARRVERRGGDGRKGEDADGEDEADGERRVAAGRRLGVRCDLKDGEHDDEHTHHLPCTANRVVRGRAPGALQGVDMQRRLAAERPVHNTTRVHPPGSGRLQQSSLPGGSADPECLLQAVRRRRAGATHASDRPAHAARRRLGTQPREHRQAACGRVHATTVTRDSLQAARSENGCTVAHA